LVERGIAVDDLNPIAAKGVQELAEAQRQRYGVRIQELVQLGATRELAAYLVGLEIRLVKLEQGLPTSR
jgi:hypothetical protein